MDGWRKTPPTNDSTKTRKKGLYVYRKKYRKKYTKNNIRITVGLSIDFDCGWVKMVEW